MAARTGDAGRGWRSLATSASTVQGIDVASLQHSGGASINWAAVAAADYKFAFIKVSEGSYYANPYYAGDGAGARGAGMFVAPYAFAIPNYSGGALRLITPLITPTTRRTAARCRSSSTSNRTRTRPRTTPTTATDLRQRS